jgi:peptidoglycan/xylan/chitin deacetylase (PgdA/CDA1 family)
MIRWGIIELNPAICQPGCASIRFVTPIVGYQLPHEHPPAASILAALHDASGQSLPLAARRGEQVELFFDFHATLDLIEHEHYPGARLARPMVSRLPFDYSLLPMWLIGLAARLLNRPRDLSRLPAFPAYPLDYSADLLFGLRLGNLSTYPLAWPEGRRFAIVLTHDVDTAWVFKHPPWLDCFLAAEEENGFRSAWYVVPIHIRGQRVRQALAALARRGHELGVHGYNHDAGLPDLPAEILCAKLQRARELVAEFEPHHLGYRAPWLSRSDVMYGALEEAGYLYDTSRPTVDFQRGNRGANNGCCTLFPFLQGRLVLLPISLPQDAMIGSLGMSPQRFWDWILGLIETIKARHGVVVISTHLQPHHSANPPMFEGYRRILKALAADADAWKPLPREVAQWARSQLRHSTDSKHDGIAPEANAVHNTMRGSNEELAQNSLGRAGGGDGAHDADRRLSPF